LRRPDESTRARHRHTHHRPDHVPGGTRNPECRWRQLTYLDKAQRILHPRVTLGRLDVLENDPERRGPFGRRGRLHTEGSTHDGGFALIADVQSAAILPRAVSTCGTRNGGEAPGEF